MEIWENLYEKGLIWVYNVMVCEEFGLIWCEEDLKELMEEMKLI